MGIEMKRVPEREAAKAAGERFYFTGKPCKNGHTAKRYTGTGLCSACATANTLRCQKKGREHPNRTAARAAGLTHFSGLPCKHGHDLRWVSNNVCVECEPTRTKRFRDKTPGIEAKWARERRAKDPTGHRANSRKWRAQNLAKATAALKRWKSANPERVREIGRVSANNRRAKIAQNGGTFTIDDVAEILEKQNGHCAACPRDTSLEIDHILPVVLGGSSDPINLQLLCLPCNRSKGKKHPDVWREEIRLRETPNSKADPQS